MSGEFIYKLKNTYMEISNKETDNGSQGTTELTKKEQERQVLIQRQQQKQREEQRQAQIKDMEKRVHFLRLVNEIKELEEKLNERTTIENVIRRETVIATLKEVGDDDLTILEFLEKKNLMTDGDVKLLTDLRKPKTEIELKQDIEPTGNTVEDENKKEEVTE